MGSTSCFLPAESYQRIYRDYRGEGGGGGLKEVGGDSGGKDQFPRTDPLGWFSGKEPASGAGDVGITRCFSLPSRIREHVITVGGKRVCLRGEGGAGSTTTRGLGARTPPRERER